jgi:nicotinamide-nucleotide amidase
VYDGAMEKAAEVHAAARAVMEVALARSAAFAVAESCTGGLVASALTALPGISAVFLGGIVAYANEAKRDLLHVEAALLAAHGAVSDPVARAMATGACAAFGARVAVATTGIAGPSGGSAVKPVGLVYIAAGTPDHLDCRDFRFAGDRAEIMLQATVQALRILHAALSTLPR